MDALTELLESGPESKIVKPAEVYRENIKGPVKKRLGVWYQFVLSRKDVPLESIPKYQCLVELQEQGSLMIKGEEAYLLPVVPDSVVLAHAGLIFTENGSNLSSLRRYGVWGNPDEDFPTYVKTPHCSVTGSQEPDIALHIDTQELVKRRSVFIDPESVTGEGTGLGTIEGVLGKTYFVCGGIPREAITGYCLLGKGYRKQIVHKAAESK